MVNSKSVSPESLLYVFDKSIFVVVIIIIIIVECRFKTAIADVTVISPGQYELFVFSTTRIVMVLYFFFQLTFICFFFLGTGMIEINGRDINYFEFLQPKETVS